MIQMEDCTTTQPSFAVVSSLATATHSYSWYILYSTFSIPLIHTFAVYTFAFCSPIRQVFQTQKEAVR